MVKGLFLIVVFRLFVVWWIFGFLGMIIFFVNSWLMDYIVFDYLECILNVIMNIYSCNIIVLIVWFLGNNVYIMCIECGV